MRPRRGLAKPPDLTARKPSPPLPRCNGGRGLVGCDPPRSPISLSLPSLEQARQRRATTAAELRALLAEEAASEARRSPREVAPSSPGMLTGWMRRALERDQERRREASPCPEIEARYRELASVAGWEVEPESGPVTVRPGVIELGMWAREEK